MEESKSNKVVNLLPDSLNFHRELVKGTRLANESNTVITVQPLGSAQPAQNASLTFDAPITSSSLLDSVIEVSTEFVVTYADAGNTIKTNLATALAAIKNSVGFQPFPINRCIESCSLRVNSMNVNCNPNRMVESLLYSMSKDELRRMSTLAIPDHEWEYNSAVNGSVLRSQSDAAYYSRGYGSVRVVNAAFDGGANKLTVTYAHKERLLARGTGFAEKEPPAFVGVTDLSVNLNLSNDFAGKVLAIDNGANGFNNHAVVTCAMQNMRLKIHQFRPHVNMQKPIPKKCYYNAPMFEYSDKIQAVPANATGVIESGVRAYNYVPKMYVVYASTAATAMRPERLFPITNISVNSGVKMNLLQSYETEDLYAVSRKNGYNGTAAQFFGGLLASGLNNGSMLIFTPSDLDSDMFHQSNVQNNHTFQVRATIRNPTAAAVNLTLHVVSISDTYIAYDNGRYYEQQAALTPAELPGASDMFLNGDLEKDRVMGGSVWGWIKKAVRNPLFKAATRFARNNLPGLKNIAGDNTAVGKFAKSHGYGKSQQGNGIINLGGKKLGQKELLDMLS